MSARSETLAKKVDDANTGLLNAVESTTDAQWKAKCADGEWTQGFSGFHAASSIGFVTGMVQGLANGVTLPPMTMDDIDRGNAEQNRAKSDTCTKQQTLDAIKTNSPAAAQMIRALTDEQLDRKVSMLTGMPEMTIEQVTEMLLIGHPAGHTASIVNAR